MKKCSHILCKRESSIKFEGSDLCITHAKKLIRVYRGRAGIIALLLKPVGTTSKDVPFDVSSGELSPMPAAKSKSEKKV